ncbi:hypothetical protein, partial [Streptomyces viridochromogenes]|uniref:hypothetical protein n=1 Tax=Streptomyces viridochromogenes TaxID=1938 RepID=UPI001F3E4239
AHGGEGSYRTMMSAAARGNPRAARRQSGLLLGQGTGGLGAVRARLGVEPLTRGLRHVLREQCPSAHRAAPQLAA